MKPYLVFIYSDYYPLGAFNDFRADFDTFEEAKAASIEAIKDTEDNAHIWTPERPNEYYSMYGKNVGEWVDDPNTLTKSSNGTFGPGVINYRARPGKRWVTTHKIIDNGWENIRS